MAQIRRRKRESGVSSQDSESSTTLTGAARSVADGASIDLGSPIASGPHVTVVGLGPAGPEHLSISTRTVLATSLRGFLRTRDHPAATVLAGVTSFDHYYEESATFEEAYAAMVEELVASAIEAATAGGTVVYGVPGSPLVAERTVEMLRSDPRVTLSVIPALSFLDLAWDRLGVDPLSAGVRLVDATRFAVEAADERGPLLVAQCWSKEILSSVKLSAAASDDAVPATVTVLYHLGLDDERVEAVSWWDMDKVVEPDHLTSLFIPSLRSRIAGDVASLEELARTLREKCPWDREQTRSSVARHILEESYEVIDAIDALTRAEERAGIAGGDLARAGVAGAGVAGAGVAGARDALGAAVGLPEVDHLREELGDLLFQVVFQACLASEEGRFTLADVARGVHEKLVARHPHVFSDVVAETPEEVAANWEEIKKEEKGRESVTDGIPTSLPSLALASKLQRKALSIGLNLPDFEHGRDWLVTTVGELRSSRESNDDTLEKDTLEKDTLEKDTLEKDTLEKDTLEKVGPLLFGLADLVRRLGVDPEEALRATALSFKERIADAERRKAGRQE